MIKKITQALMLTSIVFTLSCKNTQNSSTKFEQELLASEAVIKKSLPMMVDSETQWDDISVGPGNKNHL